MPTQRCALRARAELLLSRSLSTRETKYLLTVQRVGVSVRSSDTETELAGGGTCDSGNCVRGCLSARSWVDYSLRYLLLRRSRSCTDSVGLRPEIAPITAHIPGLQITLLQISGSRRPRVQVQVICSSTSWYRTS